MYHRFEASTQHIMMVWGWRVQLELGEVRFFWPPVSGPASGPAPHSDAVFLSYGKKMDLHIREDKIILDSCGEWIDNGYP